MQLLQSLLLITTYVTMVVADAFSSTALLSRLLVNETEVVSLLEDYIQQTELHLNKIRRYVDEFEYINPNGGINLAESIVSNPLHAYKLVKTLTIDWPKLEKWNQSVTWKDVLRKINNWRENDSVPGEKDLQGAAFGLVRIQDTYALNASDLAKGKILDSQCSVRLTARDCLYLGKHAYQNYFTDFAIKWYDEALRRADIEQNPTVTKNEIQTYLKRAIKAHNDFFADGLLFHTFQEPITDMNTTFRTNLKPTFNLNSTISYLIHNNTLLDHDVNFLALCRGERLMPPETEKDLLCYLSIRNDPYFLLHPIKVEEHSLYTPIYTFYDVISDNEIEQLLQFSASRIRPSTVIYKDNVRTVSPVRTSQVLWLLDNFTIPNSNFSIKNILNRISWITNLNIMGIHNAEWLQIGNYGIGGHYEPHYDYMFKDKSLEELKKVKPFDLSLGDRMATFLFYLSDVTSGGATAFPLLGTAIYPKKGAAAFWYNLRRNGAEDKMTLHGACPVLLGTKWIANKWIRERNQIFTRPCGLTPEE